MATIITKFSSTSSAVPLASDLVQGELAVNTADKRLFTENNSAVIIELGTNPSSITTGAITATGTVTANSSLNSSNAVLTGGTVNGMVIGGSTPQAITGTLITANTNFAGALTGNVTGNVTGNLTGNITGDVTGNLTASSGTTTVNDLVVNGTVDFTDTVLTNLAAPSSDTDAATKGYVDTQVTNLVGGAPAALDTLNELAAALNDDAAFNTTVTNSIATKLPLAGGTMSGAIAMGTNKITGLGTPTAGTDASTKAYADTMLPLAGGTMTGNIVLGSNKATSTATPSADDDLTRKGYVDGILGSATSAATSAANAATSESNAATSASNAATSESNAATSATNAANSYDSFDDRYLGAKASDPTLDNDGDALVTGATYFNSSDNKMKVYTGSAWTDVAPVATSITASQISDVTATAAELNILDGVTATTAELNYVDGVTSNIQTQLDNISVTAGTLTKTFVADEAATITLSGNVLSPVVGVTKEVPQSGVTNNNWDVNSTTENYTRLDSAPATTLDFDTYDVSTGSFVDSFSVASQDDNPTGLAFSADGTKMFVTGRTNDKVFQYALSTAFDVSTSSYTQDFSVSSQASQPAGIAFNNDGTKMFVVDFNDDDVNEYALTTGFDISTASYTQNFSVASQETVPHDIAFNNDGTKMFICGNGGVEVNEYALTTGFDISTASFTTNFSVSAQEANPRGLAFNSDGTKMFVCGTTGQDVNEYALTTGFDISTASYTQNFSVSAQDDSPKSVKFNTDGTKMFILGDQGDDINEYTLPPSKVVLGSGSFASADVGKTIEANSGVFILTSTAGAVSQTTAPTSYAQVASGSWEMYGVVFNTTDGDLELSGFIDLTTKFDVSTAAYSQNFSVATQETSPQGVAFNNDGTKMFVVGFAEDKVFEYTLSTGFDVSTASSSQSFSVTSEDTLPSDIAFNSDGTKMFIVGISGNDINEYALTTGFDVSTASFTDSFSVTSQETSPRGLAFNNDGTKMFVVGSTGDDVNEYNLSTGFDVSTASYSQNFSVSSQDTAPTAITFNTDGTKMFIVGGVGDAVYEYALTTGFDVSTASYSQNFSISSQEQTPTGIAFNTDGSKMFITGQDSDAVNEYTVGTNISPSGYHATHTTTSTDSTYWTDINSMTADEAAGDGSVYYAVSTDDRATWKIAHNTDGIRSIVRNNSGTWQYNSNGTYASTTWTNATTNTELNALQEAMTGATFTTNKFDISTASYSQNFSVSSEDTSPEAIAFNSDGTKMFVVGSASDNVNEYDLTTGFDVSTATYSQSFYVNAQESNPRGIAFNTNGTKMFIVGNIADTVFEYDLTTGFDVSTASYSQSFSVSTQETFPTGIAFNTDGTKMFIVGITGDDVNEYTLSTGFDVSTASYSQNFSVASQDTEPRDVAFNTDGTKMFILGNTGDDVNEYTLTTGFDVSTASYSQNFSVSSQETAPLGLAFNDDGSKMYVVGDDGNDVNEYAIGTANYTNQMNKTQLDAVSDANHFTLGNDLDLAIVFNLTSGTTVPSSDGVSINYDANVLNKGAILGTDYDYDAPAQNKVRITALTGNNLKVRVV